MSWEKAAYIMNEVSKKIAETGVPPSRMKSISVQAKTGGMIHLFFTPPDNTNMTDSSGTVIPYVVVAGVMIRKKQDSVPTSPNDGVLVANVPAGEIHNYENSPMIDDMSEHIGETWYYRFFPRSTVGTYNISDNDSMSVSPSTTGYMLIYGFDQDFTDLNPDTQITYPSDVENANFEKMVMNEAKGTATAGNWLWFIRDLLHNAPYMVKRNGQADYELDHVNFKLKADGTASDWNNTSYSGMPAAWLSTMYKKEWYTDNGNVRHVRFCEAVPTGESASDWIPVGYSSNDVASGAKKGVWIPIGGLTYPNNDYFSVTDAYNASSNGTFSFNCLGDPYGTRQESTNSTKFSPYIGSVAMVANAFCNNQPSSATAGQFSTLFGGPILDIIRDYLYMFLKTSNLHGNTYNTNNATSQAVDISSDHSVIPGFCGKEGKACRIFYSYIIGGCYGTSLIDMYHNKFMIQYARFYSYWNSTYNMSSVNDGVFELYDKNQNYYSLGHLSSLNIEDNFYKVSDTSNNYFKLYNMSSVGYADRDTGRGYGKYLYRMAYNGNFQRWDGGTGEPLVTKSFSDNSLVMNYLHDEYGLFKNTSNLGVNTPFYVAFQAACVNYQDSYSINSPFGSSIMFSNFSASAAYDDGTGLHFNLCRVSSYHDINNDYKLYVNKYPYKMTLSSIKTSKPNKTLGSASYSTGLCYEYNSVEATSANTRLYPGYDGYNDWRLGDCGTGYFMARSNFKVHTQGNVSGMHGVSKVYYKDIQNFDEGEILAPFAFTGASCNNNFVTTIGSNIKLFAYGTDYANFYKNIYLKSNILNKIFKSKKPILAVMVFPPNTYTPY